MMSNVTSRILLAVLGLWLVGCEQPVGDSTADSTAGTPQTAAETAQAERPVWVEGVPAAAHYRDARGDIDEPTRVLGGAVYEDSCKVCHDTGVSRAPQRYLLAEMTPESIYRALTDGVMQIQSQGLSDAQKLAVAEFIPGRKFGAGDGVGAPLMCEGEARRFDASRPVVFSGWGLSPEGAHFIPTEVAGITAANVDSLKLKWALAFPNANRARSQPAIAGGAIFVGSHDGSVFALDRETGCARWVFHASAEVRTGIVVSPTEAGKAWSDSEPLVYFGDLVGNAYAVSAVSGELVWRQRMDDHPATTLTGTPALHDGVLFIPVSSLEEGAATNPEYPCCTFRGSIVAVDAATGAERWRTYLVDEPPARRGTNPRGIPRFGPSGVPMWSSPAIDAARDQLYATLGDNYSSPATALSDAVIAVDLASGKINWHYQATEGDVWNGSCEELDQSNCPEEDGPDFDFGAGAVLATASDGRDYVLAGQKSGTAYGLDPDSGKLIWQNKVGRGGVVAGIHFGLAAAGDLLYVPVSDVPDGNEYEEPPRPGLYAVDIKTGMFRWRQPSNNVCADRDYCHPGYSGAITATPELLVAGSNDGYLRIHHAVSGELLWELDTVREFTTVNGSPATGGSMGGGAGPLLHDGLLIMNSGYGFAGKMPGNVLMVFEAG